jgi:hypothetical protein
MSNTVTIDLARQVLGDMVSDADQAQTNNERLIEQAPPRKMRILFLAEALLCARA